MKPVATRRERRTASAPQKNARAVALDALVAGGAAAEHLDRELRAASLSSSDRSFATELAYGTIKMRRALEWSVARHITRPFSQVDPRLRWILLIGAYQLLYLDRVPAHSAVDESVELARAVGHRGIAGFANAVLRKVASERARPPAPSPGSASELALYASLPDWIGVHLIDRFGFDVALAAAQGMNRAPRRALRLLDASVATDLSSAGVIITPGRYGIPECAIVDRAANAAPLQAALASGSAAWQSEESQLAVHVLDPKPDETILDACCGRGVKTMMIAGRLAGSGAVWSIDDDERKLAALRTAAEKSGRGAVHTIRADARAEYPDAIPRTFDAAIVDAPCSGLGIIGRRPDARWRKHGRDPHRFAAVQAAALSRAAERVRPGGRLLYVTCSTSSVEDEAIVDAFLNDHGDWEAVALPINESIDVKKIGPYALTVPGIDGADGFFYAKLQRKT